MTVLGYSFAMVAEMGQGMIEITEAAPEVRWDIIRQEYEGRHFPPRIICERHGITRPQLRYRREMEGWLTINARPVQQMGLLARMLQALDIQVRRLEMAKNEPIEKQARTLSLQVATLDKILKMGAAKRNVEPPTVKDVTDLQDKLVRRIEQFRAR